VGTFHGNPYESAKWGFIAKTFLRISERLFVQSCTKLTSVCQRNVTFGKKVVFIPNGVEEIRDDEFTQYQNTIINYERLAIEKGKYILFASGRLDKRKGLHYLLDAYSGKDFNNQLVIVSNFSHDIEYSNLIDSKIRELDTSKVIVIKKLLPKNDLYDIIKNAMLVVFPSEVEAMSMFVLEVLACEKILVCSDIESNVQIVGQDYKYMFKSKDVNSLSITIRCALEDIESDNVESTRCKKEQLQQKYNWKKIVGDYCSIYKSLES
jgi:glycosyltransferase involved in cell wall biosynthesis